MREVEAGAAPQTKMREEGVSLGELLEKLTGQEAPLGTDIVAKFQRTRGDKLDLGYSQLNELLLYMGCDRVSEAFFRYLANGSTEARSPASINTLSQLENGVERFRRLALLRYGNVKYGFKSLSRDAGNLRFWAKDLAPLDPKSYRERHHHTRKLVKIPADEAYLLGYLTGDGDPRRARVTKVGIRNLKTYLASDHLDVYVATSMRKPHEFYFASKWIKQMVEHSRLKDLRLRWFDPTQAYCADRIDKGLIEALMLQRAKCTVYLAQETDTFGKDSEVASTLARGKTVVAFVPEVHDKYVEELLKDLVHLYKDRTEREIVLEQLMVCDAEAAWKDQEVRLWLDHPESYDVERGKSRLQSAIKQCYDRRAENLKEFHPLGIQVHVRSGVAVGLLVVRSVDECAELLYRVMTQDMKFTIEEKSAAAGEDVDLDKSAKDLYLREEISDCVYRVMSGNRMLNNSYWDFYSDPDS